MRVHRAIHLITRVVEGETNPMLVYNRYGKEQSTRRIGTKDVVPDKLYLATIINDWPRSCGGPKIVVLVLNAIFRRKIICNTARLSTLLGPSVLGLAGAKNLRTSVGRTEIKTKPTATLESYTVADYLSPENFI